MIGLLLLWAASAPEMQIAADQTSVVMKCKLASVGDAGSHDLDVAFFDPPVSWAQALNFRDPDHLLPSRSRPLMANSWPTAFLVSFVDPAANDRKTGALSVTPSVTDTSQADARIDVAANETNTARSYSGQCAYTQGRAAEAEFRKLQQR